MRASERLLTLLLLCVLTACDDAAPPGDRGGTAGLSVQAPYGVVADVAFKGDPSLFDPAARVYVFLREPGQRMPVAVTYFEARELPKQVFLSTRAPVSNAELIARLSPSGRIERSPEDREATQKLDRVGHPPATVRLELRTGSGPANVAQRPVSAAREPATAPLSVRATVSIDSTLGLDPDTPVFVIARAGRTAMPLAVRKLTVAELPAQIELGDADSMLVTRRLSSARSFTLQARVSPTGRTERSQDDPESAPVTIDSRALPDQVTLAIHSPGAAADQPE